MQTKNRLRGCIWIFNKILLLLDFICSFLEMHLVKIVSFSIMCLCCFMVNALHMIIVVMLLISLMFGISALRFSFNFIGPYLSILFLCKMAYQTDFVPKFERTVNCTGVSATFHSNVANTILDPVWWGFVILKDGESLLTYYKGYIFVFLVMTLQTVIRTRQKIVRIDAGEPPEIPHVLYLSTTRKEADESLKQGIKYLINYGFYKFGVEITLSFCVMLIVYRIDAFAVLYALWILILFMLKRATLAILWPFFFTTLLFSILWQYTMALGLSKNTCFEYPWADQKSVTLWLFLPSFTYKPNTAKTLVDFVLLLLIQRQQAVFELEKRYGERYLGGSNKEINVNFYSDDFVNPTPNHTINYMSWIGFAKFVFMTCFFRITLAFLFWNGASNVNIISLGYLVGAFVFLWIDYDLCLWPINKILRWWNTLLGFTVGVILLKTLIECAGCLYKDYFQQYYPWLKELLCINCYNSQSTPDKYYSNYFWDVVCFLCVIFQRRYFKSYYFLHEMDDFLGIYRLQKKGAKLIDQLHEHKLKKFQERERRTLMKIKKNMNRIKAWQKRMQGLNYNEPTDHTTATYMGDYFMFEDFEESTLEDSSSSSDDDDDDDEPGKKRKSKKYVMTELLEQLFSRQEEAAQTSEKDKPSSSVAKLKEQTETKEKKKSVQISVKDEDYKEERKRRKESESASLTEDSVKDKEGEKEKRNKFWKVIRSFLDNCMIFLTAFFKKYSKDYRYIQTIIKRERRKQKKARPSKDASRESNNFFDFKKKDDDSDEEENNETKEEKPSSQKLLVNLVQAFCMFFMSKTELFCYVLIFLHTVLSPTLISIPLPMLVFLWGSLTSVRPTTTFWTVLIAYTEITVVIKALFQNSIFPWNRSGGSNLNRPEYPPVFLGIHRNNQFVTADLFMLLLLFLHRYKLKTLGLWNRMHEEETFPPKNMRLYRELLSEKELKDIKGNRSLVYQRKLLISNPSEANPSVTEFMRMAIWKCTSRATAKMVYRGDKIKTKILIKEIEGQILVTHEGRRLQPTHVHISQVPEDELEGSIVLRVYSNDIVPEKKDLPFRLSWIQHLTSLRKFFIQILVRDWRVSTDFYTRMFIFEFLDFLIIFFGYSSFIDPVDNHADEYFNLMESQVPPMYLVTLIAHFLIIIIDRVLYLRKNVVGKLILQIILVILIHVWMFIVIPFVTESSFNRLEVPQTYYIFACFYFLMSAYQLRVGYPVRVQGHFLCNKYGYVNYYCYKGLQLIPFFNQLRTLLDYLCTHSSFTMTEWIKMESIFALVYENKCSRRADTANPSARGKECPKRSKYAPGVFTLVGSIIVIWLPFIVFALFNTVAIPNLPQESSLKVYIGNFGKIFETTATLTDVITFTPHQYTTLQTLFQDNKKLWSFLSWFDNRDVGVLKFRFEPYKPWSITPLELAMLNETLQNLDIPVSIYVTWVVERIPRAQIVATAKGLREIVLSKRDKARQQLADVFLNKTSAVRLNHVLPKFLHITNEGKAKPLSGFMSYNNRTNPYRSVALSFREHGQYFWWRVEEIFDDEREDTLNKIPYESKEEITIFTFNQKNIPNFLLMIRKKGIIGLYLSIVIVSWTFIKRLMWKYPFILYTDMPNPDPVLKLCHDIYLARGSHEFALEEDLYAKLLFLFRSPETMIKFTRLETNMVPR